MRKTRPINIVVDDEVNDKVPDMVDMTKWYDGVIVPILTQKPFPRPCAFDIIDPEKNRVMGLVCRCPKCSPRCTSL